MKLSNFLLITFVLYFLCFGVFSCQSTDTTPATTLSVIPEKIDFNFHVRPILSDRCFACHGPDEKARKADLRLDLEATAFAALDSLKGRYAIVKGDIAKSELIHRIISKDPELVMPPPESNLTVSEREIKILKRWIEQGAPWKSHWAFIPPQKSAIPSVSNSKLIKNPIDNFVINRLTQDGLSPMPTATKEKLIRRLSFDLRGIPPSLPEIDAFLAENTSTAYEHLVQQFIAEESYGERMATEWMDLARYADSHGYQDDLERSMWPWRDWVINAFNENMSYKKFVSWQLAGDLYPEANYEQKLATGFNRNHKITQEGGVIDEEYRTTYVLDRVNTFSTAFLGLTVECAQCHDHKYDPISQKEYYSLFSFFNQVPERGRVAYGVEVAEPSLPLPDEKVAELKSYITSLFKNQQEKVTNYAAKKWATGFDKNSLKINEAINEHSIPKGLLAYYPLDYLENGQISENFTNISTKKTTDLLLIQGKYSGGLAFTGNSFAELNTPTPLQVNRPFALSLWIKSVDNGIKGQILATPPTNQNGTSLSFRVNDAKYIEFNLENAQNKSSISIISKAILPGDKWTHVAVTYDGSRKTDGLQIYLDGQRSQHYVLKDNLKGTLSNIQQFSLGYRDYGNPDRKNQGMIAGQLDELMLFNRQLSDQEILQLVNYNPIEALIAKKKPTKREQKRLFYHQLFQKDAAYLGLTDRLVEYKIRAGRVDDIVSKPTMVMADMDTIRPTYVLDRGQYDAPAEKVQPKTPQAVLPYSNDYPKNRFGLSQWLFDEKNPLTARVAVNRYWQLIFGTGLVATPGDFGSQGTLPSHPELLDWLAVEFVDSNWDVKKLIQTMVLSNTYQQVAVTSEKLQLIDPDNSLLSRGSQERLAAETVRDHALAISGLLSPKVGGPSVKPYQPKGLWLEVASGNQSLRKYIQEHDDDLYRRSMYTFWKRTIPPPSMTIFDAPMREQCTVQRQSTSTPMQALVLLNDPQFTEASKLIAIRMLKEGGETATDRIKYAFRLATSRLPNSREIKILSNLLQQEKTTYDANPTAAKKLLSIGEYEMTEDLNTTELAAYTVVANAILNLTETIRKG